MNDDEFFSDDVPHGAVVEEDVPRDGRGRYLLPHPVTGDLKGRTRVTTLASSVENGFMLTRWRIRTIIRGMGLRADLMARAGAADPDDDGYNKLLDSIADAAFEAGGGSWGSNLGTAQHKVFERHFFHGVSVEELPEYFRADLRAVRAALEFHGIELLPNYIERTVYNELYDRGGRLDAIGRLRDGTLAIVDLKTEKDPKQYPKGKTVQLSYYAYSELLMNYDTQQYEPMPQLHRDFALVIWCRPGSGQAQILEVPINIGWVGARIAEQNRAWNSMKIVVAPYMSDANYAQIPADLTHGVTTDGQTFFANTPNQIQQQPVQQVEPTYPTTPGFNDTQPLACADCGAVEELGHQHAAQCRIALSVSQPAPPSPNGQPAGNYAQVAQIVNQAMQGGQQLGPDQMAHLNQQAAAIVAGQNSTSSASGKTTVDNRPRSMAEAGLGNPPAQPPGQSVVGPGTNYPITAGIYAEQPAQPPAGVAPDRPPAPKGNSAKLSPADLMNDLINRSQDGIDEEAFWLEIVDELKNMDKKRQLQPLLRLLEPGITEKALARHREPLAQMVVERVKQQREIRARQAGGTAPPAQETPAQVAPPAQETPVQAAQPGWAQTAPGGPDGHVSAAPGPQPVLDLTYEAAMAAIESAPSPDRLTAIYQQWVGTYGPQNWIEPMNVAYWQRMNLLNAPTPVG